MKDIEKILTILLGVAGIIGFMYRALPLPVALVAGMGLFVLGIFMFVPWMHKTWEGPYIDASARNFHRLLLFCTGICKMILLAFVTAAFVIGITARHGPKWVSSSATDVIVGELPATHPDILTYPAENEIVTLLNPRHDRHPNGFLAVHAGGAIRFEQLESVLEEVAKGITTPVTRYGASFLFFCLVVAMFVGIMERVGARTFSLN